MRAMAGPRARTGAKLLLVPRVLAPLVADASCAGARILARLRLGRDGA
jgi:hypothetical protein